MNKEIPFISPKDGESFEDYKLRVYTLKDSGELDITWVEMAKLFEQTFGIARCDTTWMRDSRKMLSNQDLPDINSVKEAILEYKKERYKVSDERTQNNALIRRMAREETIKEIALETAREMSSKKILSNYTPQITNINQEAILQISDWHYGIEIDNFWNKFNTEECVNRVSTLLYHTKKYLMANPVKKIHVVNLGDLIAGRIHSQIRLQSRYDVVTQTLHVAEMLAEFLTELSSIAPVEYYDCLDNHSRVEPNKAEHLDLESLARIIPWFLSYRLEGSNIKIHVNTINEDIITFNALDGKYAIGGVHGHKDRPGKVVDNLTMMTKIDFDLILTAHLHHFSCDEKNETVVVSNGSLMGTDSYAVDLRLSSTPSQNIIIVNDKTVVNDIHRVVLN